MGGLLSKPKPSGELDHIIAEILTSKCPGCSAAFDDFEGCCELTCMRCGIKFCGFCHQVPAKGEVYAHVKHCSENSKPGHAHRDAVLYPRQQLARKKRLVAAYLNTLDPTLREAAWQSPLLKDMV